MDWVDPTCKLEVDPDEQPQRIRDVEKDVFISVAKENQLVDCLGSSKSRN